MEPITALIAVGVVALLVLPFVLAIFLARPLVNSLADLIAGKRTGQKELKDMQARIRNLESDLNHLRSQYNTLEDSHEFSLKLLQDMQKPTEAKKIPDQIEQK